MNEHIEKLLKQATHDVMGVKQVDQKQFAELLIIECAEVCYDHSRAAGGVDTAFGHGYKDCGDDIKRHFGVE